MGQARHEALEAELSTVFQSGNYMEVLRRLIEGHGPEIHGYLIHTMRNESDAAEVFSRLCEDMSRGIYAFEGRCSFRTWAYRLATNARARFWSDPYRRLGGPLDTDMAAKLEQQVRTATQPYLRTDIKDRFASLREHLDPEEQSLLTLRLDRDLSWLEIAQILEGDGPVLSEKQLESRAATWRQRFKRLKNKLRELADEAGLLETL